MGVSISTKPHICFISADIYTYLKPKPGKASGGAERQQYMIATELRNRGYDVSVIVGDHGQPKHEIIDGIEVWKGCPAEIENPISIPWKFFHLIDAIRQTEADVFYVRGAPRLLTAVSLASTLLRKNLIFCVANESDIDPEYLSARYGYLQREFYYLAVRKASAVITQTKKQKQMIGDNLGVESTVIPNGYGLPPESEIIDHASRDFVLWVGRSNERKKKPLRFLELAKAVPEAQFVMITRPGNEVEHHERVKNNAESIDNIRFVDTVMPEKIHKYFRNASLLVNTSDFEGFPNTFLEAWRYETPVVSLYYSVDDAFENANVGICSGSMDRLIDHVHDLHNNEETRARMGRNARDYVTENYILSNTVDRYESLFQATVNR